MSKRTNLIWSLVISIFTLIYIILDYIGFLRQLKLHYYQPESYLKNYENLERADTGRIILIFSGWDSNSDTPFLNSLLDQTVKVDDIIAIVAHDSQSIVPKMVTMYKKIKDDSLTCSLAREGNLKTKMVFILKKKVFDKTFLQDILESKLNKPKIESDFILTTPELCENNMEILKNHFAT